MNEYQRFALEHPLAGPDWELLEQLSRRETIPGGNILRVVLAVDR